jgi:hypothetical protein
MNQLVRQTEAGVRLARTPSGRTGTFATYFSTRTKAMRRMRPARIDPHTMGALQGCSLPVLVVRSTREAVR